MDEYRVIDRMTELPRGSYFYAVPEVHIETGTLALFGIGPSPFDCEYTIIGRWFPNVAGSNWIQQPSRWIRIAEEVVLWVIGRIVPIDDNWRPSRLFQAGLLIPVAGIAILELSDMLRPFIT
jgi:hypothetical protein